MTNLVQRRRSRSHSSASKYVDYHNGRTLYRQRHSHSPSDGMILTAQGLLPTENLEFVGQNNEEYGGGGGGGRSGYRVSEVYLTH